MSEFWLEPDYYNFMKCKCGDCRQTCCSGWEIGVTMKDYYRLIGLDCSEELHHRLETAFRAPEYPTPQLFRLLSPNWQGDCPLLDTDGLCLLQKECGESVLSEVCRMFPRSLKNENGRYQACCSAACEAVVELLRKMDSVHFVYERRSDVPEISDHPGQDLAQYSEHLAVLMKDRAASLPRRLHAIYRLIHGITEEETAPAASPDRVIPALLKVIEVLDEESFFLQRFSETARCRYRGADAAARYAADRDLFEAHFPDWERFFENLLVNNLLYADVPYADPRIQPEQSSAGLLTLYGILRLLCIANTAEDPKEETLIDTVVGIFHMAEHTAYYYNAHILVQEEEQFLIL